jgi:hypothetical protein
MSFQNYCKSQGIELLRDDIKFIKSRLKVIPYNSHKSVLQRYCDIWIDSMRMCNNERIQQNVGRRAANLYLGGV